MIRTNSAKFASFRKIALGAAALLALAGAAGPASASDCDPFTALFGGCQEQRIVRPAPVFEPIEIAPRAPMRARPAAHHANTKKAALDLTGKHDAGKAVGEGRRALAHRPSADAPVGSLARFAADPTLRSGDIVVTTEGFRVYRNNRFTAIAQDGGALAALEKASVRPRTADYAAPVVVPAAKPVEAARAQPAERGGLIALRRAARQAETL